MFFVGPKIVYHQFSGKYTKVPDPRGATDPKTGQIRPPVDDAPIFTEHTGFITGPFELIKPPVMEKQVDGTFKPKPGTGEIKYMPAILEITHPIGSGWRHAVKEAWHLEVNFGTEWMQHWCRIENAMLRKDVKGDCSFFEYAVEDKADATPMKETPRALAMKK